MPNRILREGILDSDRINLLTWPAEVFYRRLMSVVDDFGRFDGRVSMIRSKCYPIKLEKVSETDIDKWMNECSEAGLVSLYQVDKKPYVELLDFNQTVRLKRPKYPENPDAMQTRSVRVPESNPIQTESNPKQNQKPVSLIEFFFTDFPNSSEFERVCKVLKKSDETPVAVKTRLLAFLPTFHLKANVNYENMAKFAEHFKNSYLKQVEKTSPVATNTTSITFGKRKHQ